MHAGGQRGHRRVPQEARNPGPVPCSRRSATGASGKTARLPRRARPVPAQRQGWSVAEGLPGAAGEHRRPPGFPPDPDRDAALPEPGGVQRRQQWPLRSELRGIHPLHVADPSLPGPADPPGHPQRDPFAPGNPARQACRCDEHPQGAHLPVRRGDPGAARRAMLDERAACRRGHPRRGQLAQVRVHERPRRRELPGCDHRGDRFWPVRRADRHLRRRHGPCQRVAGRLLPLRPCAPSPGR
ncbi:hypothetical protein D3C80_1362850 [compost metagenome]